MAEFRQAMLAAWERLAARVRAAMDAVRWAVRVVATLVRRWWAWVRPVYATLARYEAARRARLRVMHSRYPARWARG